MTSVGSGALPRPMSGMDPPQSVDVMHWCARYGGVWVLPLVAFFVLIAAALCMVSIVGLDEIRNGIGTTWFGPRREIYGFSLLCVMLSLWLVLGQAFSYVTTGQAKKIQFIKGFFPPAIIAAYFREFSSGNSKALDAANALSSAAGKDDEQCRQAVVALTVEFDTVLEENFGLSAYVIPATLFAAVAFIVLFIGYAGGLGYAESLVTKLPPPVRPLGLTLDLVSVAAIFGAFTWIATDAITRNHQWTFHPTDLSWYTLRLVFAVPLGQAIAITWSGNGSAGTGPSTGAFLAFVISMFSLERITTILGNAATKFGGAPTSTQAERDDIILTLPGVDEEKARALALEGISTILQLKSIDPIRSSLRTGLPFEYIVSLIDAAILWNFVGNDLPNMRPFGFPGASYVLNFLDQERIALCDRLDADIAAGERQGADQTTLDRAAAASKVRAAAEASNAYLLANPTEGMLALLAAIDAKIGTDPKSRIHKLGLQNTFSEISADDYAVFIRNMYNTRS
jgi:hypothetical protein